MSTRGISILPPPPPHAACRVYCTIQISHNLVGNNYRITGHVTDQHTRANRKRTMEISKERTRACGMWHMRGTVSMYYAATTQLHARRKEGVDGADSKQQVCR